MIIFVKWCDSQKQKLTSKQTSSVSMTDELRRSAEEILPSAKRISNLTFNPLTGEIPEQTRAPSRAAYLVDLKVHRNSLGKVISLPRLRVVNFVVEMRFSEWDSFCPKNLTSTPVGNELECVAKDLNYLRLLPLLFRSVLFTEWPRNSGRWRASGPLNFGAFRSGNAGGRRASQSRNEGRR